MLSNPHVTKPGAILPVSRGLSILLLMTNVLKSGSVFIEFVFSPEPLAHIIPECIGPNSGQ